MFASVVGIQAGPQFVTGLHQPGLILFLAGIIVTIVPILFALLTGKYFFKMHPGILLGACAGARASTAALSVIQDAAQSRVPALGFTVCYAVANSFRLLLQFLKKKPMCAQVRTKTGAACSVGRVRNFCRA
jgi:putative transport protein